MRSGVERLTPARAVTPSLVLTLLAASAVSAGGCGGPTPPPIVEAPQAVTGRVGSDAKPECCKEPQATDAAKTDAVAVPQRVALPDVPLVDQDGRTVGFATELVGRRVAAVEFVFTRCTTTCPVLGLQFQRLQRLLGDRLGTDFALISISVDPQFDTPALMKAWGERFGAKPGWILATGPKPEVDRLLKALGSFSADRANHQNTILVIDGATGAALRVDGTATPATVARVMRSLFDAAGREQTLVDASLVDGRPGADDAARAYFNDARLVDQNGVSHRFYSDLLRDKTVVISAFFSNCRGSCLVTANTLTRLQERLGERLGRDVRICSLTVDRANDTPETLAAYAKTLGAKPGWYFLTGERRELDPVLKKLGLYVELRESHSPIFLVGNLRTGLWKKVFGLGDSEEVIASIESVAGDAPTR
ncbi:MAG: SCO family protein [Candidatus Eremiobacteraeota bacterium]|nr:SCO family protein [Candidatus Eremiobacteraeota bacterium]